MLWLILFCRSSQAAIVLGQIYETDRDSAVRRLSVLSSFVERQRSNADYYSRNLTVDADMLCREKPGAFFNRLQYPLLMQTSQECDQFAAFLRKDQISTARPYKDIAAIASEHYGYAGDCPRAERIAETVLVIPCSYALRTVDVERIATSANQAWGKVHGYGQSVRVPSFTARNAVPPKRRDCDAPEPHHSS